MRSLSHAVRRPRPLLAAMLLAAAPPLVPAPTTAQAPPSTVTFENRSADPVLVKLVGPSAQAVEVPPSGSRTVPVAAGGYYFLARFGADPRRYSYVKGDPFTVRHTATEWADITITLQAVVGGNYHTRGASKAEFDRGQAGAHR